MTSSEATAVPKMRGEHAPSAPAARLVSLDVFRGLVMLVLVGDPSGGFSFYAMAELHPEHPAWQSLARAFTHVQWTGCSLWDLVMPAFIFIAGVSMPYSYASRKASGETDTWIRFHAAIRSAALLVLFLNLSVPARTYADLLWPFVVLAIGLPAPEAAARVLNVQARRGVQALSVVWWIGILAATTLRAVLRIVEIPDLQPNGILPSLGLAYLFAFLFVGQRRVVQVSGALLILVAYWLAFALFPLPAEGSDLARFGVTSPSEAFPGFFGHWTKGANVAAALDRWLLNLPPRPTPFLFNSHGYQTLSFVPIIVTLLFGVMTGEALRAGSNPRRTVRMLFVAAWVAIVSALVLDVTLVPIVKSLWTPSWTLFSAGWILLAVVGLHYVMDIRGHRGLAAALVPPGLNPLLLYVLANEYRWYFLEAWRRLLGSVLMRGYWLPILQSLLFMGTLWLLAMVLHRRKLFVRL